MGTDQKAESTFKIKDNRRFNTDGSLRTETESPAQHQVESVEPETAQSEGTEEDTNSATEQSSQIPLEMNFATFILSLASSAQINLGLIPHPLTGKPQISLESSKQTIDIIGMLDEKTRGNLDSREEHLVKQVLYELRMQYVEVTKKLTGGLKK